MRPRPTNTRGTKVLDNEMLTHLSLKTFVDLDMIFETVKFITPTHIDSAFSPGTIEPGNF